MANTIENIYTTLSGGKTITSDEYVIKRTDFTSIMLQRFMAELLKNGIIWNGENIAYHTLVSKDVSTSAEPVKANNAVPRSTATPVVGFSVGIDIQAINDLPTCRDYWEDTFYKIKFKPQEIAYCIGKDNPRQSFAGIYSSKEALVKCDNQLHWDDILITHNGDGKPEYRGYSISISHSGEFVVSVAIKTGLDAVIESKNTPVQTATKPEAYQPIVQKKEKNYTPYIFLAIIVIIGYIIARDFIIR